ncbi:MAG: hypothetical protein NZ922_04470 [Candidatus Methanomethyliaceae archaeon]|nr:hypothetical protein [Candidatus Methanomethyliaceae archaeon]MDW7971315.1 hypothetical protein [Nitrososphaerota archaeon]
MICDECKINCSLINGIFVCRRCGLEHCPDFIPHLSMNAEIKLSSKLSWDLPCIGNYPSDKERLRAKFYSIASLICQLARLPSIVAEEAVRIAIKNWKGGTNSEIHVLSAVIYVSMHMDGVYIRLPEEWEIILNKMDLRRPGRNASNGYHRPVRLMAILRYIYNAYGKLPDRSNWYWKRLATLFPSYLIKRASKIVERPRNLKEALAVIMLVDYEKILSQKDFERIKEMAKVSIKKAKILSEKMKESRIIELSSQR